MTCNHLRTRLKAGSWRSMSSDEKSQLMEHIRTCELCSDELQQEKMLNELIDNSGEVDKSHIIPMKVMRSRVDLQLRDSETPSFRLGITASLKGVVAVSFVALLSFAVYTGYFKEDPVLPAAYEVALDGVSLRLAVDKETICDILFENGLPDASYDLVGCESTCRLIVFNLNSFEEATTVVDIFHSIDNSTVTSNVIRVENANTQTL